MTLVQAIQATAWVLCVPGGICLLVAFIGWNDIPRKAFWLCIIVGSVLMINVMIMFIITFWMQVK